MISMSPCSRITNPSLSPCGSSIFFVKPTFSQKLRHGSISSTYNNGVSLLIIPSHNLKVNFQNLKLGVSNHAYQLHIKHQCRSAGNPIVAPRAVRFACRDDQAATSTHAHSWDATFPAGDHRSSPKRKGERLAPDRAVELLPLVIDSIFVIQPTGVVHRHELAGGRGETGTNRNVDDLQRCDIIHVDRIIPASGEKYGGGQRCLQVPHSI